MIHITLSLPYKRLSYSLLRAKIIRRILRHRNLAKFLSQHFLKFYLRLFYENWQGRRLCYSNPRDLNQALIKLSFLNSRDRSMRESIPPLVDKYKVRQYISQKGYSATLNELYGVYYSVDDITTVH